MFMKNYRLKIFAIFLSISLLCGCDNVDKKVDNAKPKENKPVATEQIIKTTETKEDNQSISLMLNSPNEINLLPLYFEGFRNSDPKIRFYSCYKMIDYYNNSEKHSEIKESLKVLLNDSNSSIRNSAEFVLSLFEKTFNGERYSKSPNGKYIAFYNFGEIRYNDGICYVYNVEEDCIYSFDNSYTNINGFGWSPDGNLLCVFHGGRTWSDISFIDVKNYKTYTTGVQSYIYENQKKLGYVIGKWDRPDPTTGFIEWSPDMKKALLSYTFIDDDRVGQKGLCIYNLVQAKIEKIVKLGQFEEDHPSIGKPDNFEW